MYLEAQRLSKDFLNYHMIQIILPTWMGNPKPNRPSQSLLDPIQAALS